MLVTNRLLLIFLKVYVPTYKRTFLYIQNKSKIFQIISSKNTRIMATDDMLDSKNKLQNRELYICIASSLHTELVNFL